ncbi:GNAT family N-acetyltransferase [Rhodovulum sp. ES.010]|uniref:GNAT family N-acetyltransferase n=1 Tax=Rhodovulum sp. ES.010 TaxID=1882821 RepID=UPI000940D038|nr:GNAT family N-acetyltransferase [Rhodovulum sp. ES.010]
MTDPRDWTNALSAFERVGLDDVYFRASYAALHLGPDEHPEAFLYEADGELFFMPWLVRQIDCPALSRPAYDFETPYGYGGPLATCSAPDFLAEAWRALGDVSRDRNVVCGFMRLHPLLENGRFCPDAFVEVVRDRETVVLSLDKSPEEVWAEYSGQTRNKVRKGQKAGVEVVARSDTEALRTFAAVYEDHMVELGADEGYFFGEDYFLRMADLGQEAFRVYLARHEGRLLGGALILLSRRWAHYHLSSSLAAFNALVPNNMLRHAVAMDLLGGPWEKLHFGGGRTPDPKDSLLKFKAGYSPERAVFQYGKYLADDETYRRVCDWWAEEHPDAAERFGQRFLKYRYH